MVIGKGGAEIEKLRLQCEKMLNKPVVINIVEVKAPDTNAQLVAENIAQQLEKENFFPPRYEAVHRPRMKLGAKGIKTKVSGRLGGAEIARANSTMTAPFRCRPFSADIDYGFAEASTTYGRIGVKVWLYRGEVLQRIPQAPAKEGGSK